MSAASEVRAAYRDVIAQAEAKAAADVELGISNLRIAVEAAEWPWERGVLAGHLARLTQP